MDRFNFRDRITITDVGGTFDELLEEIQNIQSIIDFQAKFEHLFAEIVAKLL
jgi:hypothetical protein